jgi:hypothetical protein
VTRAVRTTISALTDRGALLDAWASTERALQPSAFLSSIWIGALLDTLPNNFPMFVASFADETKVLGLSVLGRAQVATRLGAVDTLTLHATGVPAFDRIHIELNGLLIDSRFAEDAAVSLCALIEQDMPDVNALHLPGMSDSSGFVRWGQRTGWIVDEAVVSAPYVDLRKVRDDGCDYVGQLQKKARYAVRTARRRYQSRYGELRVVPVEGAEDCVAALSQLEHWSRVRWASTGGRSAFESEFFCSFHRTVLRRAAASATAQLLNVFAGETLLGCLYTLNSNGWVCFYQGGYDYSLLGEDAQPGFAVLPTVIEFCAARGDIGFDFLAHASQYKRDLATASRELTWATLGRPTVRNRLARAARAAKRRISRVGDGAVR